MTPALTAHLGQLEEGGVKAGVAPLRAGDQRDEQHILGGEEGQVVGGRVGATQPAGQSNRESAGSHSVSNMCTPALPGEARAQETRAAPAPQSSRMRGLAEAKRPCMKQQSLRDEDPTEDLAGKLGADQQRVQK